MAIGRMLVTWLAVAVCACGGDSRAERDDDGGRAEVVSGRADAAARDSGAGDAAVIGAGGMDAGKPGAGKPDAEVDAGARDAGTGDAQVVDAADGAPADAATAEDSGHDATVPRLHGLEARVANTTCFLNGTPPLAIVPVAIAPAFAQLSAPGAAAIVRAGSKLAVVERAGRVRVFAADGDGGDATAVLDLGTQIRSDGLRAAVFRPDGGALIASFLPADDPLRLVVARFALDAAGNADAGSKEVLLSVPVGEASRAGGALAFLLDGTLVIAFGDGGDSAAAGDRTQLPGKIARIALGADSGFSVPADNPFLADDATRDEIYALGLGAPTSCSVDRINGRLWCADAGGATMDVIVLVNSGATLFPIQSFKRSGCGALVGPVSRDARLPDIQGALVYGDACSASLQALRFDGSLVRSQGAVSTLPAALRAFGEDASGRLLAVDGAGALHALVRPQTPLPAFPTSVAASGCLSDMATRAPAPGLVPFEVRAPLWSDAAGKRRFLALPGDQTIGFTMTGAWQFPIGTLFMKEFLLDDDADPTTPDRIMETRFLIKRSADAWEGYSYMWDRERKDAFLLEGSEIGRYPMKPGALDVGGASVHRHTFPDRVQCLLCHNAATGRALGLQTARMNTDHDYDGFVENQLQAMSHVGLFGAPLPAAPDALPRLPDPADENAPLEGRARAWLYANCAHCHQPGGPTPVPIDFRFEASLADTRTCGLTPRFVIAQIPDGKIIDPGHADNSELFFRLSRRDANQMPPIATLVADPVGVDVLRRWIDSLNACP